MSEPQTPSAALDSRPDTIEHIMRVRELLYIVQNKLEARGFAHDQSKLREPEKSAFDRLKALALSGMAYGSPEYRACLKAEKPAIEHHYACNSHHPEFYANGVDGMSLLDVLEMLVDWKAATERMKEGGDIEKSLLINAERFELSSQLASILRNTIIEMDWIQVQEPKDTPTPAPAEPPQMSPGTVNFPPTRIDDALTWDYHLDEDGNTHTYNGGQPVFKDANGLWINNGGEFRTYLQPSATLDPLP